MLDKPKRVLVLAGTAATMAGAGAVVAPWDDRISASARAAAATAARPSQPCGTFSGRGCAPDGARVDLAAPSFSNPAQITNQLFPISRLRSVVLLGHVDGKPFRTETTLLPGTRTVDWNGRQVEVLISQYVAYLDGRLAEVALDRYAQADDGSVWYLGEDVFDYERGTVAATEGTWLAGRDGPGAMIMPANPTVGDTYRPENAPHIVFEEVTVKKAGVTVAGPQGPVTGAIVTEELHRDGTRERKVFAPGYGEFRTAGGGDLEAIALAVPSDALPAPPPAELQSLASAAEAVLESVRVDDREAAVATLARMQASWRSLRRQPQPPMIAARLDGSLKALARAIRAKRPTRTAQAAIDVLQPVLDLQLRHRPATDVDVARFHLRTQQLRVHAAAGDRAGVTGDVAALEWIRDRIADGLTPAARDEIDLRLRDLRAATDARNLPAAADHAARLGARIRNVAGAPPSG